MNLDNVLIRKLLLQNNVWIEILRVPVLLNSVVLQSERVEFEHILQFNGQKLKMEL